MNQTVPQEFWVGVEQFNQRQFYDCHDTLEAIWMESPEFEKKFYQGILQIAVALYHLGNRNWQGSVVLLGEGIRRLHGYQPDYARIDVAALIAESSALLGTLQQTGPDQVEAIAQQLESSALSDECPTITVPTLVILPSPE